MFVSVITSFSLFFFFFSSRRRHTRFDCDWSSDVSGSGPAYVFLLAEAMEAAGIAQGLPADAARTLVVQTLLGASRMLDEAGESPAELRRRVTSPNGTTQAAIESFQAGGFEALVG